MSVFSIYSPNLSFIPPTVSEKIDAKVTNIAFSIWSVQNSATKGIQGMQAVLNLPISAWLPLADLNGGKTAARCRSKSSADCLNRHRPKVISLWDALDGPRRRKNTIQESTKVSRNFIGIFRPRRNLNVQFSEPHILFINTNSHRVVCLWYFYSPWTRCQSIAGHSPAIC